MNRYCYSLTKGRSVTICTLKKNAEALLVTSKETGLEHGRTTFYGKGPHHYCGLVSGPHMEK